jgi:hypothetical protein
MPPLPTMTTGRDDRGRHPRDIYVADYDEMAEEVYVAMERAEVVLLNVPVPQWMRISSRRGRCAS